DLALGQMLVAHQSPAAIIQAATSASTACPNSVLAPLRKTSVSGSENVPGWVSSKTLVSVTAYHSFGGEVEALNTPTIRRLTPSCRHQLSALAQKSFPDATVGGDLCVLCQQPLSADAVQRRTTFESFVKGTAKADEERAAKAYDAVLAKAAAARVAIDSIRQLQTLI